MWIVKLALRRPYTFLVLAILITLLGVFSILRTPTDIFPNIKIPVVAAIWRYTGLSPDEMATRLVLASERTAQTTVNDVEHTESQSLTGTSVVKYFFQPNVNEELSFAQITGVSQTGLRQAPPGTTPPFILAYNASSVPILQLALSSDTLSEAQLFDLGQQHPPHRSRRRCRAPPCPTPTAACSARCRSTSTPTRCAPRASRATTSPTPSATQNSILPAGTQKIGDREYFVSVNANPRTVAELNEMPVTTRNGTVIYVQRRRARARRLPAADQRRAPRRPPRRAHERAEDRQRLDARHHQGTSRRACRASRRSCRKGSTSTWSATSRCSCARPSRGVVREAVIAAALTALMILLFLGSWRSTLIIAISIPLSILASIICLAALGETINIMTLGGLALAVGILVDDATVTIENINYHLEHGEDVEDAILNGAHEIAVPAFVSTLAICIVFVPMFMLTGIARYLFVPLAEAVVFAMLASYLLSRTLVPTLAKYWLHQA